MRVYRQFLTLTGDTAAATVPLAFNDPAGTWKFSVTDLASGMRDEVKVKVE